MSKLIDITGQDFGYWHVIKRGPNAKDGRSMWLCHCTLCDKTTKLVSGAHLRSGRSTSCGCTKMEKMRQKSIKHEEGKTYGFLYVERMATENEKPRKDTSSIYWNCTCTKCGRKDVIVRGDYLRNGDTKSCGCMQSVNESKIAVILTGAKVKYKQQFTFDDLTSTGRNCDKLMFDFAIFNTSTESLLYVIEYDGIQHFSNKHEWHVGGYEITHANDLLKNKYCFDNNIPIIRIPYDAQYNLLDLKLDTTRFLLTPENEKKYYER